MKDRITISIDKKLLEKLDKKVADGTFGNRSHGISFLIKQHLKEKVKQK